MAKKAPRSLPVPPLLRALGQWLAKQPRGSLGYFDVMGGGTFSDGSMSRQAVKQVVDATGIFMTLGDGSQLALWRHGDAPPAVVLLDSEGQHRTVAPNLEAFLEAWSKRKTGTDLDGLGGKGASSQHAQLAAWLQQNKVKVAKHKAPRFEAWLEKLRVSDAPPSAGGLPGPPSDLAPRAFGLLGKKSNDKQVAALLAELGIDLKKYKTADSQRFLLVPSHGYSLSIDKGIFRAIVFAQAGHTSHDYVTKKQVTYSGFPHEILKGARVTDSINVIKKKLGKPADEDREFGDYSWKLPGNITLRVQCVEPDDKSGPLSPGTVQYIRADIGR